MGIDAMRHIGIYVRDIKRMAAFYKETLGLIEVAYYTDSGVHLDAILKRENANVTICKLVTPYGKQNGSGDMVELIEVEGDCGSGQERELYDPGLSHIAFSVKDIFDVYDSVIRHGGQGVCAPLIVKDSGNYLAFCRDIEGNYLELIQN